MSDVEAKSERGKSADLRVVGSAQPAIRAIRRTRIRIVPLLITLATTALAVGLGWATWNAYMERPWTRDGTVRVYTVTMAPYPNKLEIRNRLQQQRSTASSKPAASKGGGGWLMSAGVEPQAETLACSRSP